MNGPLDKEASDKWSSDIYINEGWLYPLTVSLCLIKAGSTSIEKNSWMVMKNTWPLAMHLCSSTNLGSSHVSLKTNVTCSFSCYFAWERAPLVFYMATPCHTTESVRKTTASKPWSVRHKIQQYLIGIKLQNEFGDQSWPRMAKTACKGSSDDSLPPPLYPRNSKNIKAKLVHFFWQTCTCT